ncbi:ABC transporter permease [Roseisolibacter sp. H3M3-2]|uniref:ABC transporter permease n=1 Tax=Roseisolibacter sp. H3M3-2 TaxID=3031323 RepID=UPI0023DACD6B|nr:ABC transporter permease [Roseisolibacter sp. H3M3-2]MDF1502748.1 ABC transporter permease [Roseisolibacter sp. H3M3-2]
MGAVYLLTLRQLTGRGRLAVLAVLAALPMLVAVLLLRQGDAPSVTEFETAVLSAMLAGSIAPLVVLAIAAAAFGNETEDRTLANLTLSPLPRRDIAVAKLLAALTVAAPFIALSAAVTGHVAFLGDARATLAIVAAATVGVMLYASAFTWLGLVSAQAIGIGLLYIVLWEGFFSGFVAGVRLLSIRHYAIAVMHGLDERRFAGGDHLSLAAALAVSAVVFGGFLLLSVRRLRRMDVP